jgi:hypothetical protein
MDSDFRFSLPIDIGVTLFIREDWHRSDYPERI